MQLRTQPKNPLNTSSGARSACSALPANRRRACSDTKYSAARRRAGNSANRGEQRERHRRCAPTRRAGPSRGRGNRREQRAEQTLLDALPTRREQLSPRIAVAEMERVEARGGLVEVGRDDRAAAVARRMGEHDGCPLPVEPVLLEMQVADRGRRERHRIERAEHVVDVAGLDQLFRAHRAAGRRCRFEHAARPTRDRPTDLRQPTHWVPHQ